MLFKCKKIHGCSYISVRWDGLVLPSLIITANTLAHKSKSKSKNMIQMSDPSKNMIQMSDPSKPASKSWQVAVSSFKSISIYELVSIAVGICIAGSSIV